ncbi:MAG: isoprenylcysteine carboxylmethyltransferase family protein [Gammaproteobacteria bacterium]|jgi:protein-S-isoprenylcysteine O-methyltransferase Ste14|nr:protein-S-isoprenylcysteine methyltransferase [Chromatiales bacterium]MCP4925133.1 isoprenylcysteine carboxylmethyltransferase family protein [Gammaproteobacteria bacterium]
MLKLQLKIPPLVLMIILALIMQLTSLLLPGIRIPILYKITAFVLTAGVGIAFTISGGLTFRKAKTTFNPMTPNESSSLVTDGIYRRTRNPMYLGFLLVLIGWGLFLSNIFSLAVCAGFVLYMNSWQIKPEESALEIIFGDDYLAYKSRVRRWL